MSHAILEKDFKQLSEAQQNAVVLFVRFLMSQKSDKPQANLPGAGEAVPPCGRCEQPLKRRKLGGFEQGFRMSPDFDEPIPDFAEYM